MHPEKGSIRGDLSSGMIRVLGVQQTNEVKATQNLAIIVLFFMICWFPLYTINCIIAFNPDFYVPSTVMLCSIILSHLNSAGNPLLYAYHLKDFRAALKNFFLTLFDRTSYCEPVSKNARDYNSKLRKRACSASTCNLTSLGNKPSGRVKLIVPEKISTIVKSSAVVAAATTGEINHAIWNISENSVSSSDSLKSVDSLNHEKCCLMIRPATPYRPRSSSDFNSIIKGSAQDDESDDGFNEEETLPYHDYGLEDDCKLETCFTKSPKHIPSSHKRSLSNSSPQISIGLYYVERDRISLQGYPSNGFEPNRVKSGANGSRKGLDTLQRYEEAE
ncbi:unnamed protein product [Phaedon cochleariae]|uniref:G-protein coupled receptors family 1 profile domain-containing protein n=1 Tax=Phaedon cochleariae TaxID=80249 RepID=A0A9N9WZH9_PHACE|nr:unnamed protein product [Phaedon cochleariae]